MKKIKDTIFVCSACGNEFGKWLGQCTACGEWNSIKEVSNKFGGSKTSGGVSRSVRSEKTEVVNLGKIDSNLEENVDAISTTISEFDRVLGKGIVHGSVTLFSGEPGIGKSTLLTQLVGKIGGLYVAGEESAQQIGMRVKRLGLNANNFDILGTNSINEAIEYIERTNKLYKIVVVDSIQVMSCEDLPSGAGSVGQIRESTFKLVELAKRKGVSIMIVGHVTKDGDIAGPKLLEHMVDTVLYFEGEKNGDMRILRANKNRFGPTDEVGVFKMEEAGLREVKGDELSMVEGNENKIGATTTIIMEGSRPMMVEIQALVIESFSPMPKRIFSGVDFNRAQLLVAVAQKSLGIPLYKYDVFLSVTGGVKINDTGADLAVVGAIWSSFKEKSLNPSKSLPSEDLRTFDKGDLKSGKQVVLVGEVSLLGEVKKVRGTERRKKEAENLGRQFVEMGNIKELKSL